MNSEEYKSCQEEYKKIIRLLHTDRTLGYPYLIHKVLSTIEHCGKGSPTLRNLKETITADLDNSVPGASASLTKTPRCGDMGITSAATYSAFEFKSDIDDAFRRSLSLWNKILVRLW